MENNIGNEKQRKQQKIKIAKSLLEIQCINSDNEAEREFAQRLQQLHQGLHEKGADLLELSTIGKETALLRWMTEAAPSLEELLVVLEDLNL